MNISPVGDGLFHADGTTDMMKLTVAFRKFANVPKKACWCKMFTDTTAVYCKGHEQHADAVWSKLAITECYRRYI
jgi:hypothetical protein